MVGIFITYLAFSEVFPQVPFYSLLTRIYSLCGDEIHQPFDMNGVITRFLD